MKTLEQKIMARVRRIYYLRKLFGPTAVKLYTMFGIVAGLFSLVSVANVVANMPGLDAPSEAAAYLTQAALHTEGTVQLLLAGFVVVAGLMIRDIVHGARHLEHTLQHA